jgi:PTH1 family peptidyl-tRNA hydrolase
MILDEYLKNVNWRTDKTAQFYKTKINDEDVIFLKPTTYMNLSGQAVFYYVNYYKIKLSDILIIQDDLDLELGKIRLKFNSSSGGHNGIKNIIELLKTQEFLRLKIGISKSNTNIIDFVLSKFTQEELNIIKNEHLKIKAIIDDFISNESIERLMSRYN